MSTGSLVEKANNNIIFPPNFLLNVNEAKYIKFIKFSDSRSQVSLGFTVAVLFPIFRHVVFPMFQ